MSEPLLKIDGLRTAIGSGDAALTILDGIEFTVSRGEVLGLIGESGSGKTMLGLSVLRLEPRAATVSAKSLTFLDHDLLRMSEHDLRALRGTRMAMIFQDPVGAFNPAKSIGWHMRMALARARSSTPEPNAAIRLLGEVGIADPQPVLRLYPHQLSGGMLQRALIAMVLGCGPDLIVADEPTTNLDALVEQQIIALFRLLLKKISAAMIYITHDITIAAALCDRIAVMYAGQIVEEGTTRDVFGSPKHPYTQGLLGTALALDRTAERLQEIAGDLPTFLDLPPGCRFQPRCPVALPVCVEAVPAMNIISAKQMARCVRWGTR